MQLLTEQLEGRLEALRALPVYGDNFRDRSGLNDACLRRQGQCTQGLH